MNVYDSARMMMLLRAEGWEEAADPKKADMVIVNTCAIREKAVQKMASFIGRFSGMKKKHPEKLLAVAGCVAQQQKEKIVKRFPYVDIVLGTHAVNRLPGLVEKAGQGRGPVVDTEMSENLHEVNNETLFSFQRSSVSDFVTIMRGCDNFCTYCVVPYVRGPEINRKPGDILTEIRAKLESGMKEVTLLGQNVNSYGKKEGMPSFPELLEMVNRVEGLERIRFVTSHPKDLSQELIDAFESLEKLCMHIHLPVQSGSDRILKKMNRRYTAGSYLDKIERLRSRAPDISLTTDIIAGFPGETEEDFRQTLELVRTAGYDSLFAFEYSDRPEAPSRRFPDKVAPEVKNRRLRELFELQEEISRTRREALVGRTLDVLVEGESRKQKKIDGWHDGEPLQLTGRTTGNRIVNFSVKTDQGLDIRDLKGQIIPIRIEKAFPNSLWGIPEQSEFDSRASSKGGYVYVA